MHMEETKGKIFPGTRLLEKMWSLLCSVGQMNMSAVCIIDEKPIQIKVYLTVKYSAAYQGHEAVVQQQNRLTTLTLK